VAQQVVPWVLIRLGSSVLALESSSVRELLLLPQITPVPNAGVIRGMVTLRNQAIAVIDLRQLLGMRSLGADADVLNATLVQRAEDHRRWLAELEASVTEHREFKLTLDPHQCAFGKWYDTFTPSSVVLQSHMKRFDQPHKQIHALGARVGDLVRTGRHEDAQAQIATARATTLATLLQLFDDTPKILAEMNREMLVVLRDGQRLVSITADAVESVEAIRPDTVAAIHLPGGAPADCLVTQTARTAKTGALVLLLDVPRLLRQFTTADAQPVDSDHPSTTIAA